MAGIYIHIPFCKQACHYCNFYFSTSLHFREDVLKCIHSEIELRKDYLGTDTVQTIYFGGGTPSLLTSKEISPIIDAIRKNFIVEADCELTMECNPDDLTADKLDELSSSSINRLSIGIQSFFDADLKYMNRAHNSQMALESILNAQKAGFDNITIDLIYGTPGMNDQQWKENLQKAFDLQVPHISSYALTVEEGTALFHQIRKGKSKPVGEEQSARQFEIMIDMMGKHGFEQYEISNFCQPGYYSKHNSAYWLGKKYLGIGPSAHSFDGVSRSWNIANNLRYCQSIKEKNLPLETEWLSPEKKLNEYILTSIRTIWGIDLEFVTKEFGVLRKRELLSRINLLPADQVALNQNLVTLTDKGKLMADRITVDLFTEEKDAIL